VRPPLPRTRARAGARMVLAGAALLALAGCGTAAPSDGTGADGTGADGTGAGTAGSPTGSVRVFAAASLTGAFTELATRFEAENPGAAVSLTFAGSADLISQITEGAPADVIATADLSTMARLADDGLLDGADPVVFATNILEIAVPPENPAGIRSLADLDAPGLNLVVCAPQVPCGAATVAVAEAAGIRLAPVSEENSVTDVLGKVRSGEADAGLVYRTDVAAAGADVLGIRFDEAAVAVNRYPIAVLDGGATESEGGGASGAGLAAAFAGFVTGETGQAVLAGAGFDAP
jgi:molybdate transport system substrate-binding protein